MLPLVLMPLGSGLIFIVVSLKIFGNVLPVSGAAKAITAPGLNLAFIRASCKKGCRGGFLTVSGYDDLL